MLQQRKRGGKLCRLLHLPHIYGLQIVITRQFSVRAQERPEHPRAEIFQILDIRVVVHDNIPHQRLRVRVGRI